jgi:hypothetical protein
LDSTAVDHIDLKNIKIVIPFRTEWPQELKSHIHPDIHGCRWVIVLSTKCLLSPKRLAYFLVFIGQVVHKHIFTEVIRVSEEDTTPV